MIPQDPRNLPHLTKKTKDTYIAKCRQYTYISGDPKIPNGPFPHDNHIKFEELSNQELLDYFDCYTWALNPKNFKNIDTGKGG